MPTIDRRSFLRLAAASTWPLAGCGAHHSGGAMLACPGPEPRLTKVPGLTPTTYAAGPDDAPRVMVLHELPGLTPDDLALGRCLVNEGFRVFMPLLFGSEGQNKGLRGYLQACVFGDFKCSTRSARSEILDRLEPLCDRLAQEKDRPIGVIGMCLTGVLPLALLPNRVEAAVLCQPTLPFSTFRRKPTGRQKEDLGLGAGDLAAAKSSKVPFLTIHYQTDPLCPPERITALQTTFTDRVAVISLPGEDKHSSLGSAFDADAFADAVTYLKVRLGVLGGPRPMKLAKLASAAGPLSCSIDATGLWRAS